ncbi:MAG: hypothetical protein COB07_06625 [Sulfurovum sp.]|nr:MAG: hypothetical protein COB07_06625 [Sulfurovum sp.]
MLKTYFGEWGYGKLQRLPYLGYHILLMVLVVAVIFGGIFAMGATENLMSGDLEATQKLLADKFGIIAIIFIAALVFITVLGQVNILGKRIRDMGLPVVWTILGIIVLSMVLNLLFPPQEVSMSALAVQSDDIVAATVSTTLTTTNMIIQIFDSLVFLCLVLIPSNTFGNKDQY